jgi:citrate/tricarballylate utilization protein
MIAAATNDALWGAVEGSFYTIFPHNLMVSLFAPVFLFSVLALGVGVRAFWQQNSAGPISGAARVRRHTTHCGSNISTGVTAMAATR